jgi:hypothetical protein
MQKFPQRLALDRDAGLSPLAGAARRAGNRLLDLHCGLWGVAPVVDAHVDRAIALRAQARNEAGAQNGSLPETRLPEKHGQKFALYAPRKFGDLFFASEEVGARLFGKGGKAEPGVAFVDCRGFGRRGVLADSLRLGVHC